MTITTIQNMQDRDIEKLLIDSIEKVWPAAPPKTWSESEWDNWLKKITRFKQLIHVEAYTEASLMLIPNGWKFLIDNATPDGLVTVSLWNHGFCVVGESGGNEPCTGEHPAIAITIAALAAQEFLSGY